MSAQAKGTRRGGMATGIMLACAVGVLALPSAVLAFASRLDSLPARLAATGVMSRTVRAPDEAALANAFPVRSLAPGHPFRFTPAGMPTRPDRSVTVAVRVDPTAAREITVRGARIASAATPVPASIGIPPTGFSLGVSRGYQNFAQNLVPAPEVKPLDMPDLSRFKLSQKSGSTNPRFAPRITLEDKPATGRAPRTFAGDGDDRVDLGGALKLTRNLDVTAGIRYSQDRDRLRPLTDGNQDNQAVYLGTQFRF